jgi:hypothetical protein
MKVLIITEVFTFNKLKVRDTMLIEPQAQLVIKILNETHKTQSFRFILPAELTHGAGEQLLILPIALVDRLAALGTDEETLFPIHEHTIFLFAILSHLFPHDKKLLSYFL